MSIKKCCDNCVFNFSSCESVCCTCQDEEKNYDYFEPKEELVRADEKHKFITLLKSDLENYEGLASEDMKNNNIDYLIGNNAVIRYIEETIEVLKE